MNGARHFFSGHFRQSGTILPAPAWKILIKRSHPMKSARKASTFFPLLAVCLVCSGTRAQTVPEKSSAKRTPGKHYMLPANKDTVQWGWFDPNEKPKLGVDSGDTVSIETLRHSMDEIKPGASMDELVKLRLANPGGGPHSVTGPIFVNGAEPGDVMEIRILKIVPKDFGQNFNLPGSKFPTGLLPSEFPEGFAKFFKLDVAKMQTEFK